MDLEIFNRPTRMVSLTRLGYQWYRSYFGAQKLAVFETATVTETPVDRRISLDEQGIYPYLFTTLYLTYAGWLMISKLSEEHYQNALSAYLSVITEAEQVFSKRPSKLSNRAQAHPLTQWLQSVDGPTNCYPSLHVALSLLAYQVMRNSPDTNPESKRVLKKICIDQCRSTMKIRQHSVIDVIGGYALARNAYRKFMGSQFKGHMAEILPELTLGELASVEELLEQEGDLLELLDRLLVLFDRSKGLTFTGKISPDPGARPLIRGESDSTDRPSAR